jgi:hypothetical protein
MAVVLFRYVEEPSRRWMRRMIDTSKTNSRHQIDPPDKPEGKQPPSNEGPLTVGSAPVTAGSV